MPDITGVTFPVPKHLMPRFFRDGKTVFIKPATIFKELRSGMKLRKLLNYPEPLGDFMAFVPGDRRQQNFPSTVAYLARLIIHRYAMLGILDERGFPIREMGLLEAPRDERDPKLMQGARCSECGNYAVIRKDGCDFCTACGAVGTCG